jgi:hypothetical protein
MMVYQDNPLVWKPRELENMMQRAETRKAIFNTRIEKGERYIHDPLSWSGPSEWYMLMVWWLIGEYIASKIRHKHFNETPMLIF